MKSGIAYSKKYLEHNVGPNHPEKPERLKSIIEKLEKNSSLREKFRMINPDSASVEDIALAHESSYVEKVKELSEKERRIDLDTPIRKNSYSLALLAAGGTIKLSKKVEKNEVKNGFALIRPPGHHATRDSGGGFCYFNNIAIASRKLLKENDVDRILIFDFDSHHGNGTQDIFYRDREVLYISFHQSGRTLYPGTGFPNEVGEGKGEGYTVNVPFPPGSSDRNYAAALEKFLIPISEQFEPDQIMVSAGFDPHEKDPLTHLRLTTSGFEFLGKTAINQAIDLCGERIVFVLEGGYAIDESSESAIKILEALADPSPPNLPEGQNASTFEEIDNSISSYWNI